MIRPDSTRQGLAALLSLGFLLPLACAPAIHAQEATKLSDSVPGQFFTITEPITNETIQQIRDALGQMGRLAHAHEAAPVGVES